MMFYKRKYTILLLFSLALCIGIVSVRWYALNKDRNEKRTGLEVFFSVESGAYRDEFMLELDSQSGEIYYTLNGENPNKNSLRYEAPIFISDASINENIYSMRTDVTTGFEKEEIQKYSNDDPGYVVPNYNVDKGTIIKAVAYDPINGYGDIKTAIYFVGEKEHTFNDNIKIISIVTNPDNLFDYETGIYVTGKTYDEYKKEYRDGEEFYWREEFWALWMANYRNRGKQWEREAEVFFFDNNGKLELEQTCGLRIHGGISRGYNPKSLNIYARKKYSGISMFPSDLFYTGYYPSEVVLFQGGNDIITKSKDYLVSSAVSGLNISTMNYIPYILFLNGEYWGFYWLNEKYDDDYFEYYYDVKESNVILIKNGSIEEGEEDDYKYYSNMLKLCSQSDLTQEINYKRVCESIDIDSCIDYYATMIYIGRNGDWPDSNYCLWRVKKKEDSRYGDTRWRWAIFDLNSSGYCNDMDPIEYVMNNDAMFCNLMTNQEFRTKLLTKIQELSENELSAENMQAQINKFQDSTVRAMQHNNKRFYGDDSLKEYYQDMEALSIFFEERRDFLMPLLEKYR